MSRTSSLLYAQDVSVVQQVLIKKYHLEEEVFLQIIVIQKEYQCIST